MKYVLALIMGFMVGAFIVPLWRKLLWRIFYWIDVRRHDAMPRDWYDF